MKSLYQKAFKVLEISFGEAHSWAVKLFIANRYGRSRDKGHPSFCWATTFYRL